MMDQVNGVKTQQDHLDDVDPNFKPKPIPDHRIEALNAEVAVFKDLYAKFEEEFVSSDAPYYYLLSKRWFNRWKRYVSYDQICAGHHPDSQFHGQIPPGEMNEDIVVSISDAVIFPEPDHIANVYLKDQIQAQTDYLILSEALWKAYKQRYDGVEIKRLAFVLADGHKRVEARLKSFNVIFINNQFLRNIDHQRVKQFTTHKLQFSSQAQVKDLKKDILEVLNSRSADKYLGSHHRQSTIGNSKIDDENLRIWHLDPRFALPQTFDNFKEYCNRSSSYDYKIPFQGEYLEKFPEKKLEETNVAETDYVFFEMNESGKIWNFAHPDVPTMEKCEGCYKYAFLKFPCACAKVAYCSDECKQKDKKFHMNRCTKAQEDEEKAQNDMKETPSSCLGITGLQNLGNTCFMNSGLQCLSNFKELSEYFLNDCFLHEINETNPLGTKGKLARKYANLVKNLWYGSSSVFSPWSFKHGLGQFQPMFTGYQQHDSQELLNFLLDGLHEDLNRVKDKPFVETIESDGTDEDNVPKNSWYNHLKRNQSVIVDLLYGQYKSQLTCPECSRLSITYDPFMTLSVPIPNKTQKDVEFFFIFSDLKQKAFRLAVPYPNKEYTVRQLKQDVAKIVNRDPNSFYFTFLSQVTREPVVDEDKVTAKMLRKKKKVKNLFAIERPAEDQKLSAKKVDVEITVTKKTTDYFGKSFRKPFTFKRVMSFEPNYTTKQIYLKVFKTFRFLYDEYLPEAEKQRWLKLSDEDAFKQIYESKEPGRRHIKLFIVTNTRGYEPCYFCGDRRCENCELECSSQKKLDEDVLSKIKDKKDYQFELELYFDNVPEEIELGRLNTCIDPTKKGKEDQEESKKKEIEEEKKEGGIQIYDCLRQFEQPEQLGEDNMWYCSKCKKHQRAFKKMEIYKAPPILIIHLKRFKSGTGYSSGKLQALVNFPTRNLDLSEFVKNHELPMDYPIQLPPRTKDEQQAEKEKEKLKEKEKEPSSPEPKNSKKVGINEPPKMRGDQALDDDEEKDGKEGKKDRLAYDLFGIVNHYGSTGFGHYTAYAKNWKSNKWYCFDDSSVREENENAVCTPAAYVLFYKRKGYEFKPPVFNPLQTQSTLNTTTSETINTSNGVQDPLHQV